jgi:hypothetical protein
MPVLAISASEGEGLEDLILKLRAISEKKEVEEVLKSMNEF